MNEIEQAVLYGLHKVNEGADGSDVAVFITALLGKGHIVKPLSDADRAELIAKVKANPRPPPI